MIPGNTSTPYRLIKKELSRFAQECKALILLFGQLIIPRR